MIRHRWIEAAWPFGMRALAKRIQEKRFSYDKNEGFILDQTRSDFVEGRFVEKIAYQEHIVNPLGGEQVLERIEFRVSKFRALEAGFGLELIDEPRSTKALANKLSEICDYSLSLQSVNVDPLSWGEEINIISGMKCVFTSIQLSKLALSDEVVAQIAISGKSEVRQFLQEIAGYRKYTLDKAKIEIFSDKKFTIVLGRQATVSSNKEIPDDILENIRRALVQIHK